MTLIKRLTSGGLVLTAVGLVAATAAFASHDPSAALEAPHAYTNAEACNTLTAGGAVGAQAAAASTTTDAAYPDTGFAADCFGAQAAETLAPISATAHVLANCSFAASGAVLPVTDNVTTALYPAGSVTAFDFPTQTKEVGVSGGVRYGVDSDTFEVFFDCDSDFQLDVKASDFTEVGDLTPDTKPATSFGVREGTETQDQADDAGNVFTAAATALTVGTYAPAVTTSKEIIFRSFNDSAIDPGTYAGQFTLTITAL